MFVTLQKYTVNVCQAWITEVLKHTKPCPLAEISRAIQPCPALWPADIPLRHCTAADKMH